VQIGIDSFAAAISDPAIGLTLSPVERMHHLLEEIELADKVGLDVFGIGEHHRAESFSISVLKTNELEKYLVVARCAKMWLRMYGVPRIFPIAKYRRKCSDPFPLLDKHQPFG